MSGNTTSLYSTSSSNGTTGSNNFTTLYPSTQGVIIPTTPYGNANVVALLAAGSDGSNTVANIVAAGSISAVGNITANPSSFFIGNGSQLTGIIAAVPGASIVNGNSSVIVNANGNVTTSVTGVSNVIVVAPTGQYVTGVVSATGNITGNYILGNGSQLTGLPATYGNANVTNLLANLGSNIISGTGNITTTANISGNYILGNGSQLTGLPATYGNANVVSLLANFGSNTILTTGNVNSGNVNTTSVYAGGVVSATGNVRGGNINTGGLITATGNITGNYFIGNGSQLTGLPATYGNANVANFLPTYGGTVLANLINFTNNSGIIEQGDQRITITGNASNVNTGAYFNDTGEAAIFANSYVAIATNTTSNVNPTWTFDATGNLSAPGDISTTGNVSTGNILVADDRVIYASHGFYGPPDSTFAPVRVGLYGPNPVYAIGVENNHSWIQGQSGVKLYDGSSVTLVANAAGITGANILTAGVVSATGNVTGNYLLGNGAFISGLPAGYSNADVATFLANFGSNSISTTGNITAGYFVGNGSQLTAITGANVTGTVANATYAVSAGSANTANTANLAQYVTANAQANITSVGVLTSLSASGNITGNYFIGNGSGLSNIAGANVTGTVANAAYALTANAATYAGTVTANAQPNITSVGILTAVSVSGNTTTGNMLTSGIVSATGNITGNYFIGNGSQLTGISAANVTAAGANTQLQYNNGGTFAGNAAMVFDNTTGNVTLSTLIIGNNTAGNANGATKLNTTATFVGQPSSSSNLVPGQMVIGNGLFGSYNAGGSGTPAGALRGAKVIMWDSVNLASANVRYSTLQTLAQVIVAANASPQLRGAVTHLQFGGGTAGNACLSSASALLAYNQQLIIGGGTNIPSIGNTVATGASSIYAGITVSAGSTLRTGVLAGASFGSQDTTAVIGNAVGFLPQFATSSTPTAVYGYYFPDAVTNTAWGYNATNNARSASSYYSIYNADAVAQNQLGSLRAYHTFQYSAGNTGTVNIDKLNGQIQYISPTGNVTIGSYTNFVTTASNSVSNLNQSDTVTLIIEQGATPFTVTMPTGNASIKYAGNLSTVSNVANSVTMVAITAYRTAANVTGYLTTVSPGFV